METAWRTTPLVAAQGISTHWLRHTTLTWVERHFGYGVARAYAGHTDNTGPATTTYIKASLQEGRHRPDRHDRPTLPTRTPTLQRPQQAVTHISEPEPLSLAHLTTQHRHLLTWDSWKSPGKREISYEWGFKSPLGHVHYPYPAG